MITTPSTPRRSRTPRGFLLMDVIIGTVIALTFLMAMTVEITQQFRAERRLSLTRAATRQIEADMFALQTAQPVSPGTGVQRLMDPSIPPPPGRVWVRLTGPPRGSGSLTIPSATLIGLVPATAAPQDIAPSTAPETTTSATAESRTPPQPSSNPGRQP